MYKNAKKLLNNFIQFIIIHMHKNKYIKYKKIKSLHNFKGVISHDISGGAIKKLKFKIKDADQIDVPKQYLQNSFLHLANVNLDKNGDFDNNTNKFNAINSKQNIQKDNLHKGIIDLTTNEGIKYEIRVVPFLTLNKDKQIICWSWINSIFLNLPYFYKKILQLKKKFYSNIKEYEHLNFDCLSNFIGTEKNDQLFFDILIVIRELLNGMGYITNDFEKDQDHNYDSREFLMITSIKKI